MDEILKHLVCPGCYWGWNTRSVRESVSCPKCKMPVKADHRARKLQLKKIRALGVNVAVRNVTQEDTGVRLR